MAYPLLKVVELRKYFTIPKGVTGKKLVKAVDGVSFELKHGEVLAVVGESGSGKTTLGLTALRVYKPDAGRIVFDGTDITYMSERKLRRLRRYMSAVFQNPYSSLNPRMKVFDIIAEPLRVQKLVSSREELVDRVHRALEDVGLKPPEEFSERYPYELSGGQRQRVAIARAIVSRPKLVLLDEPTSNLDVSVQAQILNLLKELRERYGMSYLFISHDLAVVSYIADRVAVMYAGKLVEIGPLDRVFGKPVHPYTQQLLSAAKSLREARARGIEVYPEHNVNPRDVKGCRYRLRCPYATSRCSSEPPMTEVEPNHVVSCWLVQR
jgi:oligopeptide/dipeptide ABC transporter ATP-binding protein